jgi:hypothetical protein
MRDEGPAGWSRSRGDDEGRRKQRADWSHNRWVVRQRPRI